MVFWFEVICMNFIFCFLVVIVYIFCGRGCYGCRVFVILVWWVGLVFVGWVMY